MVEKAYLFVTRLANGVFPVTFIGNTWQIADSFAEAKFFPTIEKAKKKQKYAPMCDIVEVSLSVKIVD